MYKLTGDGNIKRTSHQNLQNCFTDSDESGKSRNSPSGRELLTKLLISNKNELFVCFDSI